MRGPSFVQQVSTFLSQGLKADLADKERIVSPLLFASTILLLFNFVFDEKDASLQTKYFTAEMFLTLLFALQTSYARIFGPDQQDRAFDLLQTYPLDPMAWYLGRYVLTLISGATILVPTLGLAALFHSGTSLPFFFLSLPLWLISFLALAGLAAMGILLSTLTLKASGREILFPLLYFPLTVPVLLAATQASLAFLDASSANAAGQAWQWLGLLAGFDVIYLTLGLLLFGELVEIS